MRLREIWKVLHKVTITQLSQLWIQITDRSESAKSSLSVHLRSSEVCWTGREKRKKSRDCTKCCYCCTFPLSLSLHLCQAYFCRLESYIFSKTLQFNSFLVLQLFNLRGKPHSQCVFPGWHELHMAQERVIMWFKVLTN